MRDADGGREGGVKERAPPPVKPPDVTSLEAARLRRQREQLRAAITRDSRAKAVFIGVAVGLGLLTLIVWLVPW